MAKSPTGAGNPLLPIAIIGAVVVAIIAGVFALDGGEAPPDEPTVIAEDDINAEPAGAGTMAEGEADEAEEGITEQVDDVSPAPDDIDTIPAADAVDSTGTDLEGETTADEQVADTVDEGVTDTESSGEGEQPGSDPEPVGATTIEASQAGGANAEQEDDAAARLVDAPQDQTATEEFLLDEETVGSEGAENVDTPGPQDSTEAGPLPAGRDAQTNLDPSECQDIVRDTDSGGAAFIPTPVGPGTERSADCPEDEATQ